MKNAFRFTALATASLGLCASAFAATSSIQAEKLCKALAMEGADVKSVFADKDATRSTDAVLWFNLRVTSNSGDSTKLKCAVDRSADKAKLFAG